MKVIGAGFGRTGTDSIRHALEFLLDGRCYHMKELATRHDHGERWSDFVAGRGMDWAALFEDYEATVDWPGANYYAEIMAAFPEAKVLLSVRDPESWFDSFQELVRVMKVISVFSFIPRLRLMKRLHDVAVWREFEDLEDRAKCIEVFERHIEAVKAHVPEERLLVFRVQEGWDPLCEFLNVDVPKVPFPHVNSRGDIQRFAYGRVAREILSFPVERIRSVFRDDRGEDDDRGGGGAR